MKESVRKKSSIWKLSLSVIFILEFVVALFFCGQKSGFHYDEYYSYYTTNPTYGLAPVDREWKAVEQIRSEFMVRPGEGFQYGRVIQMQSWDVHPPVFYLLLHTVSSVFPGIFSKWFGLSVNLFFFAGCFFLLAYLTWLLSGKKWSVTLAVCAIYGMNPAVMSGIVFVRMYMVFSFWVLLLTVIHVRALIREQMTCKGFFIPLMVTIYLGFLTHYFFFVYLFFLALATAVYLLVKNRGFRKGIKPVIGYGCCIAGALVTAVISYPACLGHIFAGYRGAGAAESFFDLSNIGYRLQFFYQLLNEYLFGGLLPVVLLLLLLLAVTAWAYNKRIPESEREKAGELIYRNRALCVAGMAVAGYFLVISKTALLVEEEANRYQLPVYSLLLLLLLVLLNMLIRFLCRGRKARQKLGGICTGALAVVLAAAGAYGMSSGRVSFLYLEDRDHIAFSEKHKNDVVVYFYNDEQKWMIWNDSLELMNYNEIYFVNSGNTETLEDEKIRNADRIVAYFARTEHEEEAIATCLESAVKLSEGWELDSRLFADVYLFE